MLKNFKKIIFRTTAIAASSLCLGAFTLSPLNAAGPENSEEIYNEVYNYLEQEKKLFKNGRFPEYDAKTNARVKCVECYDFVPIPQASIEYASRMKVNGNDKNPEVRVVRMLAYNKKDKKPGNLDIIKNLSDDERNKLFDEYDLNSTENKIDVVIEVYDLEQNREQPTKIIHTKMRKMNKTIKDHNFVEFAIEMPTDCGFIPADVPVGRLKLYKNYGSDRKKCISDVYYSANDLRDLKGKSFFKEKDLFINCVMRFNKSVNDMLMNSIINFNRNVDEEIEKSGKELLPEYDAKTNTLGKYGECFDLVPIPQTGISYKAGNNGEFVVQRMLAFDKKDEKPGNLDIIKDLLDDKNKLFEEYDLNSTKDTIDVVIEVFDKSKGDKISNVINAKMRKISRTIKGHKFVEFAIERPANCGLVPADVPIGMVRLYKTDGSKRKYMSGVLFSGASALKSESDMFVDSIMHYNEGQSLLKDGLEDGEEFDANAKG